MARKKNTREQDLLLGEVGLAKYRELMESAPETPVIDMIAQAMAAEWQMLTEIDRLMAAAESLQPGSSIIDENDRVSALIQARKIAMSNFAQQAARWRIELNASGAKSGEKAEKKPKSKLAALMPTRKTGGA
jgi:hypothetical protein